MRTISPFEFARLMKEVCSDPIYQGYDYLNIHEDKGRSLECEFTTYTEYDDDWYCRVTYEVAFGYKGRDYKSDHEVIINNVEVNFQEVQLTREQEAALTNALTERANEEYEFYDTDGLYPDYATSKMW